MNGGRTDAIIAAVRQLLESRRQELDAATDIRELVLELKFSPTHLGPRVVIDRIEREHQRR